MLGRDKRIDEFQDETPSGSINLISNGTLIEGNLMCNGDIRVDGKVKGRITSKAKVIIGSTGEIEGEIKCQNADIFGKHTGNVQVNELLFLKASCHVNGDLFTGKLVVESGATFTGNCSMGNAAPQNTTTPLKNNEPTQQKSEKKLETLA